MTQPTETETKQLWVCTSCGFIYDPADGDPVAVALRSGCMWAVLGDVRSNTPLRPELGYCVMAEDACRYSATQATWSEGQPRRSVQVDAAYMDWAMPIIRRRLAQAGIRLAHRLNLAFDPAYRG